MDETPTSRWSALPPYVRGAPEIHVYQMPAEEIGRLCSLVEAYDGVGLVRTLDRRRGLVELWMMPDQSEEFERLLSSFGREAPMQRMSSEVD